jgi:hypothetical protein
VLDPPHPCVRPIIIPTCLAWHNALLSLRRRQNPLLERFHPRCVLPDPSLQRRPYSGEEAASSRHTSEIPCR